MAKKNGTNKCGRSASNSGARPALQTNLGATFRTETNLGAARREKKISAQLAAKRLARRRRRRLPTKKNRGAARCIVERPLFAAQAYVSTER